MLAKYRKVLWYDPLVDILVVGARVRRLWSFKYQPLRIALFYHGCGRSRLGKTFLHGVFCGARVIIVVLLIFTSNTNIL